MRRVRQAVRFIRQFIEYTLVAAFFLGIPALAALGPRVRFLARDGRSGHHRMAARSVARPRSLAHLNLSDSLATVPARPAETSYTFGPSSHEASERGPAGR